MRTLRRLERLRGRARALRLAVRPRAVILAYHRVAEAQTDPQLLCVSPRRFDEHLEVIRQSCRLARLDGLEELMRDGRNLSRSVVITFDDGYADNLLNAKPLLEKHDAPATVFVSSGNTGGRHGFWWDNLEHLLLAAERLPKTVSVSLNGQVHTFEVGPLESAGGVEAWNVLGPEPPAPRHAAYLALSSLLKPLPDTERSNALRQLAQAVGASEEGWESHRTMTPQELRQLADGGLVEIGAHTVTHPQLSVQAAEEQRWEIQESRRVLQETIGKSVVSFAYPYGGRTDYTDVTAGLVRDAGYRQACTTSRGCVTKRTDLFQLPRFLVRDWDGEEFARRLHGMFNPQVSH